MAPARIQRLAAAGAAAVAVLAVGGVSAQYNQTHNLTPDGYWHNRYHGLLTMASYGNWNTTCPNQTFTAATEHKNFPNSTYPPWTVLDTWGPTASGSEGFSALVPEMNKVVLVFKGNYELEQTLPLATAPWTQLGIPNSSCRGCTANAFAIQGYLEARNATNNWAKSQAAYEGAGLVWSVAGHGLGGMHALLHAVDFNHKQIAWYSHTYGTPRVFNQAGANWYNERFNGEAGERGVYANDQYSEFVPQSDDYVHAGTPFYYWGANATNGGLQNWNICWDDSEDPACAPSPANTTLTAEESHYFYFANVGYCGGYIQPSTYIIDQFLASPSLNDSTVPFSATSSTPTSTRYTRTATSSRYRATSAARATTTAANSYYTSYAS